MQLQFNTIGWVATGIAMKKGQIGLALGTPVESKTLRFLNQHMIILQM